MSYFKRKTKSDLLLSKQINVKMIDMLLIVTNVPLFPELDKR